MIFIFSRHVSQEYKQFQSGKQDLVRGAAELLSVFYGALQQVTLSKLIMNWQCHNVCCLHMFYCQS